MSKRRRMGGRTKESKRRARARERRQAKQPGLLELIDRDVLLSAARERVENDKRSHDAIWGGVLKHLAERCIRDDHASGGA